MDFWIAALAVWLALLCTIVGVRMGWSDANWARGVAFKPTEAVTAHQLFGLLLGANLALLEHDNFNQLASALPHRRIRDILARYWRVRSAREFRQAIDERLRSLGAMSSEEAEAFEAWRLGEPVETAAFRSLHDVLVFLSTHARVVKPSELREEHCCVVAWDVQQVAYLLRLGVTLGYVSRDSVWRTLDRLQPMVRMRYASWKDYSLSTLVGMGVRGVLDLDDIGDWHHIARSHTVLLAARRSLLARATDWSAPTPAGEVELMSSFLSAGMPSTVVDPLR